jgi:catalase-peroxidase
MGFTSRTETLTDFFVSLLDLRTTWKAVSESDDAFVSGDRMAGGLNSWNKS